MHESNNFFGIPLTVTALLLNIGEFLKQIDANFFLTLIISLASLCWLGMKMYDQYLVTKKRKNEDSPQS